MNWTRETPKVPGIWWYRNIHGTFPNLVTEMDPGEGLWAREIDDGECDWDMLGDLPDGEWLGPVTPEMLIARDGSTVDRFAEVLASNERMAKALTPFADLELPKQGDGDLYYLLREDLLAARDALGGK